MAGSRARSPKTGSSSACGCYVQVFTGDTLDPDRRRRAVAVEPMTCPANAFASGQDVLRLEPGEAVTTQWGIR